MFSADAVENNLNTGLAITTVENGEVISCGGIVMQNDDTGVVWMRNSNKVRNRPFFIYDIFKAGLKILDDTMETPHLICYVIDGFREGEVLVKHFMAKTDEFLEHNNKKYYKYSMR